MMHTLEFTIAGVESVVVSSKCRGNGYGKELVNSMIVAAKGLKVHYLHLISNPKRVVANRLFQCIVLSCMIPTALGSFLKLNRIIFEWKSKTIG